MPARGTYFACAQSMQRRFWAAPRAAARRNDSAPGVVLSSGWARPLDPAAPAASDPRPCVPQPVPGKFGASPSRPPPQQMDGRNTRPRFPFRRPSSVPASPGRAPRTAGAGACGPRGGSAAQPAGWLGAVPDLIKSVPATYHITKASYLHRTFLRGPRRPPRRSGKPARKGLGEHGRDSGAAGAAECPAVPSPRESCEPAAAGVVPCGSMAPAAANRPLRPLGEQRACPHRHEVQTQIFPRKIIAIE